MRHRAAQLLAGLLAVALVTLVGAVLAAGLRVQAGVGDESAQLVLGALGLLSGLVGAYLGHQASTATPQQDWVGVILAGTLGVVACLFAAAVAIDALTSPTPAISGNTAQLIAAAAGGAFGALGGYLGITVTRNDGPHDRTGQAGPGAADR